MSVTLRGSLVIWLLVASVLGGAGLGYWAGGRQDGGALDSVPASAGDEPRVLYYRNPMGLPDTSPVPKKDPMGMDYIPVFEGEESGGAATKGGIALSPERIQTLGVLTEPVQRATWVQTVRAVGRIVAPEPGLSTITTKIDGWIETLHVNSTGQEVRRGEPLLALYSPEMVSAQNELLAALRGRDTLRGGPGFGGVEAVVAAARERLRSWDIAEADIAKLEKTGAVRRTLPLYAPARGVVTERMATVGMRVMPGEPLLTIADLSSVWILVDVYEQDLPAVEVGAQAAIEVTAEPGRVRTGRIEFVYPTLNEDTRTVQVRVLVDNADGQLRPGMFATVEIESRGTEPVLSVPSLALLDSGERQLVFIDNGGGRFAARDVTTGRRSGDRIEVLAGLTAGEAVVTRANFLLDAESNLRSAVNGMSPHGSHGSTATPKPGAADPGQHEGHDMPDDEPRDDVAGVTHDQADHKGH